MISTFIRFCLSIFLLSLCGYIVEAQNKGSAKPPVKQKTDLYLRAPGVVPGTLPEMRQASYWISKMKDPDKVMMSAEEIARMNRDYQQRMQNVSQLDSSVIQRIVTIQVYKHLVKQPYLSLFDDLQNIPEGEK